MQTAEQDAARLREQSLAAEQARAQAMQQVEQDYQQRKERTAALTDLTLRVTESSVPTPTQEENDRAALGLLHPDEKAHPNNPEMPPLHVQQAYLATGENKPEPVTPTRQQRGAAPPGGRRPGETPPAPERTVPRPGSSSAERS